MVTILDDRTRGFALGAVDYLTKPIDRRRLVEVLSRYRRVPDSASPSPQPETKASDSPSESANLPESAPSRRNGRVLVVEDDTPSRTLLLRVLSAENWQVDEAVNGLMALEMIQANVPHIILLDLTMPEMDGFQFVRELQRNPEWHSIPVIIVTALDLTDEDRTRLNGNVIDIIMKNAMQAEELLKMVRSLIQQTIRRQPDSRNDET